LETIEHDANAENSEVTQEVQEKVNWGRFFFDIIETLFLAVVLFVGINAVSARVRVDGFSMRPTLEDGEFVLVNKMSYHFGEFSRGDIIVFHFPVDPSEDLVKRVIGLPGETVSFSRGRLLINGRPLDEPYVKFACHWDFVPDSSKLSDDEYYVVGDNRTMPPTDHTQGGAKRERIVGKVLR